MLLARFYEFLQKNLFLKDKIILVNLIMSILLALCLIFLLVFKIGFKLNSDSQLFLHYNIYFGIDWIGEWYKIYMYPLFGFLVFLINYSFAIYFYAKDKTISYIFSFSTTFIEIIIFISGICALWINS